MMLESILKWLVKKVPTTKELALFMLEEIVKDTANMADAQALKEVVRKIRGIK